MFIKMGHAPHIQSNIVQKEGDRKEGTNHIQQHGLKKKLRNRIDLEHNTLEVHFLKQKSICFSLDTLIKKLTGRHLERYIVNTADIRRGMRLGTRSEREKNKVRMKMGATV